MGALGDAAGSANTIASQFWFWAIETSNHWATSWMTGTLTGIANRFWDVGDHLADADRWVSSAWDAIGDRTTENRVKEIISDAIDFVKGLKDNPWKFVHDLLWDIHPILATFWIDPWHTTLMEIGVYLGWPDRWWEQVQGWVNLFIGDKNKFVHDLLWEIDPLWATFWNDPWHTTLMQIGVWLGWPDRWWESVQGWVSLFIDDKWRFVHNLLFEIDPLFARLWVDWRHTALAEIGYWQGWPDRWWENVGETIIDWVIGAYERAFGHIHDRLYRLTEHTVRYFREGHW